MSKRSSRSGLVSMLIHGGGPGGTTLPSIPSSSFGISGGIIGGGYTYSGGAAESSEPPIITDIVITGTLGSGNNLTITVSTKNNTRFSFKASQCIVYRSSDLLGTSESPVAVLTSDTNVFTYPQVNADIGSYLGFAITLNLDGGPSSSMMKSAYTDVVPAPASAMDIMNLHDYRIWLLSDVDPVVTAPNTADASRPMTASGNAPSISSAAMRFDRANSESLVLPHPSVVEPWCAFVYMKIAAFGVLHNVMHLGSAVAISISSARRISINGVDSGVDFPNDTIGYHLIKVKYNGASSNVAVDNGAAGANVNDTNPTIGGSSGHFGRNSGGANYLDATLKYFGSITRATTPTEDTNIYNELLTK